MAEYDREYMQEHCIDVYFMFKDRAFYTLTYGTILPPVLNDVDRNRRLQHLIAIEMKQQRKKADVHIEQAYVSFVQDESRKASGELADNNQLIPVESLIVQMFKPNAELGFYSYDCIGELEDGRGLYRLVAYPETADIAAYIYKELPSFEGIEIVEIDEQRNIVIMFRM